MTSSDEWRTPPAFFARQNDRFHFTVDAAATAENALVKPKADCCPEWLEAGTFCIQGEHPIGRFYTQETNGLDATHYEKGDRVWCNPPYSNGQAAAWVKLAHELSQELGVLWCMLLPPSIDTKWFHRYIYDVELQRPRERVELSLLPGRLHFVDPTNANRSHPTAGNMLVIFHPRTEPVTVTCIICGRPCAHGPRCRHCKAINNGYHRFNEATASAVGRKGGKAAHAPRLIRAGQKYYEARQ